MFGVNDMTSQNTPEELRQQIVKSVGKYTPTKVLREMNSEWWLDIIALESYIEQYVQRKVTEARIDELRQVKAYSTFNYGKEKKINFDLYAAVRKRDLKSKLSQTLKEREER